MVGESVDRELKMDIGAEELIARASGFTLIELELDKVRKKQQDSLYSLILEEDSERIRSTIHEAVRALVLKKRGLFNASV